MHYLIDGYNLLFKIAHTHRSLEQKRQQLIVELNTIIISLHLKASIVFDGSLPHPELAVRQHFDQLEIVYTPEKQTADQYIIEEIEKAKHPHHITVITSDRSLSSHCKSLGAHAQSIHDFLTQLKARKAKKKRRANDAATQETFRDSDSQLARYLLIFEKKLSEGDQESEHL
jgi:predicted RNA-binding protein with PIN domain